MRSTFTFNGHSCDEFGIYISKKPNINRSQRKFQSASVAGRNGNIYQFQDAWDEVVVTYDIFAGGYEQGDAPSDFTDIMEWLNSADDYARLEDSYDTEHYRMAVFVDATNIEQKWYSTGQAQIKFRCKPQHFLNIPDVDVNNLRNYYMGEIVSFDGDGQNLENLTAEIEAVQDLHGYDYPWVGGAGKNMITNPTYGTALSTVLDLGEDKTFSALTLSFTAENAVATGGVSTAMVDYRQNDGTHNYVMLRSFINENGVAFNQTNTPYNGRFRNTKENITFRYCDVYYMSTGYSKFSSDSLSDFMLELGSSATAYEPYENICPISGWDEVNVNVSGINVWDEEWERGLYNASGVKVSNNNYICSVNPIPVLPNTTYRFIYATPSTQTSFFACWYDSDMNFIQRDSAGAPTTGSTITSPSNARFMHFCIGSANYPITTYNHDISINYPSTDHDYHAYNGQAYTIDLDGTRYGGSLDVTTGVLTLTHGFKIYDGTETWGAELTTNFYSQSGRGASSISISGDKVWCSHAPSLVASASASYLNCYISITGNFNIQIPNSIVPHTATDMKSWVTAQYNNGTPLTICYELVTPQVVQLTPQEVKTLVGENNIWVDSGEVDVVTAPSIANPTNHVALPIITLTGAGASSLLDLEKDSPDHNESGMPYYFSELLPCFGAVLTGMSGSQRYVSMFTDAYAAVDKLQIASRQNSTGSVVFTALNDEYGVGTAIEVNPNTDYTISATTDRACTVQVLFFTGVVGLITSEAHASNNGGGLQLTFRTPSDCQKILIAFFASDTSQITVSSIMVNKGTEALPFRAFTTDTSETITIKDTTLKILMNGFKTAVIDCERENFSVDGADSNTSVSVLDQYGNLSDEYLKIDKGRNKVAYSDGIVSVMLKPRFWEL